MSYKQHIAQLESYKKQIGDGTFAPKDLIFFQELNYRVEVLETLRAFCTCAPQTEDTKEIAQHYQMVVAYLRFLQTERRFGLKADQEGKQRRDTAAASYEAVLSDCCKRFSEFQPKDPQHYQKTIRQFISTVLPLWIQLRSTFVKIEFDEEPSGSMGKTQSSSEDSATKPEDKIASAMAVPCPIKKYKGKTLGEVLTLDPKAINWLAKSYEGDACVKEAAITICDYATRMTA